MRRGIFVIGLIVIFMLAAGLARAGQFGPTQPIANPGKFSLGVGYFWEDTKWDAFDGTLRTQSHQGYLQGSFAPTKNFEIFGRLGGANLETKDLDPKLKDDAKLYGTLGLKVMFYEIQGFGLGAFAQGTYHFEDYKDSLLATGSAIVNGVPVNVLGSLDYKLKDYYDVQAGISAQIKNRDFIIYGGPFLYFARAKLDATATATMSAFGRTATISQGVSDTIEEKTPFGGFLGIKIPFTKQLGLTLEGQYRDNFSGGGFLSYSF